MVFINMEKACDKVTRNVMWLVLQKYKVSTKYITLIKVMYDNVMTSDKTHDFPNNIGLHQESILSPFFYSDGRGHKRDTR
jgi:hypothetical protein